MQHTVPPPEPDGEDTTAEQAAIIGAALAAHLAADGYHHRTYPIGDQPREHNWRTAGGEHEISLFDGQLVYTLQGITLLTALVESPQQIAILLSAYGVVPPSLTTAYQAGQIAAAADIDAMLPTGNKAAEPDDYYTRLSAQLHEVADQIATVTGTPTLPRWVTLTLRAGLLDRDAPTAVPLVDTIAAALGTTATTAKRTGGDWQHRAEQNRGPLDVVVYTRVPSPEDPETVKLRAEVEQLRARLAEQTGDERHETPSGGPLPEGVDGHPINGRNGGVA